MGRAPGEATLLLERVRAGDSKAAGELYETLYEDLKRIARRLFRQRDTPSLGATALVHEAYLKLAGAEHEAAWRDSAHALAVAARAMRQVLANHARDRAAKKRGGRQRLARLTVADLLGEDGERPVDAAALHEALERLEALDVRQAEIAQYKLLGGLSTEQVAVLLGVSTRTVELDWRMAKKVLSSDLGADA